MTKENIEKILLNKSSFDNDIAKIIDSLSLNINGINYNFTLKKYNQDFILDNGMEATKELTGLFISWDKDVSRIIGDGIGSVFNQERDFVNKLLDPHQIIHTFNLSGTNKYLTELMILAEFCKKNNYDAYTCQFVYSMLGKGWDQLISVLIEAFALNKEAAKKFTNDYKNGFRDIKKNLDIRMKEKAAENNLQVATNLMDKFLHNSTKGSASKAVEYGSENSMKADNKNKKND